MAVPKKKVSKSKRNQRRSHLSVEKLNIVFNKATGEPQLPHHVSIDGYYNGKKVIADKIKAESKAEAEEVTAKEEKAIIEKVVSVEEKAVEAPKKEAKAKKDTVKEKK
jgi:large subunit ribosomal protein L32